MGKSEGIYFIGIGNYSLDAEVDRALSCQYQIQKKRLINLKIILNVLQKIYINIYLKNFNIFNF